MNNEYFHALHEVFLFDWDITEEHILDPRSLVDSKSCTICSFDKSGRIRIAIRISGKRFTGHHNRKCVASINPNKRSDISSTNKTGEYVLQASIPISV